MATTQEFLPIDEIRDDLVILKDGSMAIILQTSAVNFDLLSETEQIAIIGSFAALLNSLSFSIQILIRSKRLDISHYLTILREAESHQKNPLLLLMMQHYRQFVTNIIRENEVLDKQFYVVIPVSYLEVGVVKNVDKNFQKALTVLLPRRDHIMRQLGRIGLKSTQLNTERLVKLFYDFYNDSVKAAPAKPVQPAIAQAAPVPPQPPAQVPQTLTTPVQPAPVQAPQTPIAPPQPITQQVAVSVPPPVSPAPVQQAQPLSAPAATSLPPTPQPQTQGTRDKPPEASLDKIGGQGTSTYQGRPAAAPFVVEELPDDYAPV